MYIYTVYMYKALSSINPCFRVLGIPPNTFVIVTVPLHKNMKCSVAKNEDDTLSANPMMRENDT